MFKQVHLCVKCFRRGDEACLLCILALPGETPPPPHAFPDAFLTWVNPILPRKRPDQKHHHEDAEPQYRQELHHGILPIRPPKYREFETSPPQPPSSTPRTSPL